jgi:hypothetical protein
MEAGAGTLEEVNACLQAGYQYCGKDFSTPRARHLAETVQVWYEDPKIPGRQVGWVTAEPKEYVRSVLRIAVRCPKKKGEASVSVLLCTLDASQIVRLRGQRVSEAKDPKAVLLA